MTLLEVADVMDRPRLYSTFVLWMLAQLYEALPEVGDLPKPKLAFFFDEAHLLFDDASEALLDQIERTARLIRSKGVGVYFVTQAPTDVPSSVLSQLGNRVQHALRAFTPDDADALRKTARTFPVTEHYDVERTITSPRHRRGAGHRAVARRASRRRSRRPGSSRRTRGWRRSPSRSSPRSSPPRRSTRVRRRPSTARAPTRSSRPGSRRAPGRRGGRRGRPAMRDQVSPTPDAGLGGMTPAQYEARDRAPGDARLSKAQREMREAERERKAQAREAARPPSAQRQRTIETGIRTAGRVATSRAGQSILRGVFDTIFGGKR